MIKIVIGVVVGIYALMAIIIIVCGKPDDEY